MFFASRLTSVWKEGGRQVWTDTPEVSVEALSSLLWSLNPTKWARQCASYVHGKSVPIVRTYDTTVNTAQTEKSGRCWLPRKEPCKKPQHQHRDMWNSQFTFLWQVVLGFIRSMKKADVSLRVHKYPSRVIFNILPQAVQRKHFLYQHSITASSPEMDQGDANTCLESDTRGQRDFKRSCILCSKHAAAFKSQLAKAKPLFGRGCITSSHL